MRQLIAILFVMFVGPGVGWFLERKLEVHNPPLFYTLGFIVAYTSFMIGGW